jgi:hypothetical protein
MKKCAQHVNPKPPAEAGLPDLEFPDEPGFISQIVPLEPEAILRRSEENLSWRTAAPGFDQRRLEEKIDIEFRWSSLAGSALKCQMPNPSQSVSPAPFAI